MRKTLLATSAIVAAIAFAGAASAQTQVNNVPVGSILTLQNINVNGSTRGNAQAVGNAFDATGAINVAAFNGAATDEQNNAAAISAAVNVNNSNFSGETAIGSLAIGNSISVDVGGTVRLNANDSHLQVNTGPVTARTDVDGSNFGQNFAANATALGDNLNVSGNFTTMGGRNHMTSRGGVNAELEISNSTIGQTGLNYALTGGATAIGVNASLGSLLAGQFEQNSEGAVTSTVDLDNVRGLGNGNALTAIAVGNALSLENNRSTQVLQSGRGAIRADFDMDDSYFANGSFGAQAVYNLADSTGPSRVGQTINPNGSVGADLDVNNSHFAGAVSFDSTAIGNFADLTNGFGSQTSHGSVNINASADLIGVTAGAATVNSTAAGNVMNVSGSFGPLSQLTTSGAMFSNTTIANSTFGSLTAGATTIGNSLTIKP